MNPLNYGSLEACQRLVKAGIVLETDCVWATDGCDWMFGLKSKFGSWLNCIPAPSMAEVRRELLPLTITLNGDGVSIENGRREFKSPNTTDALIDLLVWVTEQGEK